MLLIAIAPKVNVLIWLLGEIQLNWGRGLLNRFVGLYRYRLPCLFVLAHLLSFDSVFRLETRN